MNEDDLSPATSQLIQALLQSTPKSELVDVSLEALTRFSVGLSPSPEAESLISALSNSSELRRLFLEVRTAVVSYTKSDMAHAPKHWRLVVYGSIQAEEDSRGLRVAESKRPYNEVSPNESNTEQPGPFTLQQAPRVEAGVLSVKLQLSRSELGDDINKELELFLQVGTVQQFLGSWPIAEWRNELKILSVPLPDAPDGYLAWDSDLKAKLIQNSVGDSS